MNQSTHPKQRPERSLVSLHGDVSLVLTFSWLGDRYGHTIWAKTPNGVKRICASDEGSTTLTESSRPTFQELSVEQVGDKEVMCLVGMSGKAYWSASIEPLADQPGFLFDICSRNANVPQSGYALTTLFDSQTEASAVIPVDEHCFCVAKVIEHPDFETHLAGTPELLEVFGKPKNGIRPASVRWKYMWQLQHSRKIG